MGGEIGCSFRKGLIQVLLLLPYNSSRTPSFLGVLESTARVLLFFHRIARDWHHIVVLQSKPSRLPRSPPPTSVSTSGWHLPPSCTVQRRNYTSNRFSLYTLCFGPVEWPLDILNIFSIQPARGRGRREQWQQRYIGSGLTLNSVSGIARLWVNSRFFTSWQHYLHWSRSNGTHCGNYRNYQQLGLRIFLLWRECCFK